MSGRHTSLRKRRSLDRRDTFARSRIGAMRILACAIVAAGLFWSESAAANCASDQCEDAFGCCGADGDRPCIPGFFSDCDACVSPAQLSDLGTNCAIPRLVGERCSAFFPCDTDSGYACEVQPWEPALRCVDAMLVDGTPAASACFNLYSEAVHDFVKAGSVEVMTFGAGLAASGGSVNQAVGSVEIGTAYGRDGSFGCYRTFCAGLAISSDVGPGGPEVGSGSVFGGVGLYTGFGLTSESQSILDAATVGFTFKAVEFSVSVGASTSVPTDGLASVDLGSSYSVGLGGSTTLFGAGGTVSSELCTTGPVQVLGPGGSGNPALPVGPDQFVNTNAVGPTFTGHSVTPWPTLQQAISSVEVFPANQAKLFIEGAPTVTRNVAINPQNPITLHATNRRCALDTAKMCSVQGDCPNPGTKHCDNNTAQACVSDANCSDMFTSGNCVEDEDYCAGVTLMAVP